MTVPVLLGVTLVVFAIMHLIPGDPVEVILGGTGATQEQMQAMRHTLGLDLPLPLQYVQYVSRAIQGDLGKSIHFNQPVVSLVLERMPATIELTLFSFAIALALALPIGIIAALKRNTLVDFLAMTGATLGLSLPTFWVGILLIMLIAVSLGWLPSSGRSEYGFDLQRITGFYLVDALVTGNFAAFKDTLAHMVLPGFALGITTATSLTRMIRSSLLEVMSQDYVITARSKGLREWFVVTRHELRNAFIPVVTLIGVLLGNLLAGAVVTETIFAWPGIGRLVIQAIYSRDFLLVQGVVLFFALFRVTINLLTDVLYVWLDPRIKHI
jgi:ABC-type dipeptide/oligopeptide/nickel transport system permease component